MRGVSVSSYQDAVQEQIVAALKHPEAENGLHLRNFILLHEEDERQAVIATERELVEALLVLVAERVIAADTSDGDPVFSLDI